MDGVFTVSGTILHEDLDGISRVGPVRWHGEIDRRGGSIAATAAGTIVICSPGTVIGSGAGAAPAGDFVTVFSVGGQGQVICGVPPRDIACVTTGSDSAQTDDFAVIQI